MKVRFCGAAMFLSMKKENSLSDSEEPSLLELRDSLVRYILSRFDLSDNRIADVIVAWIFGTYCFELFDAFPRLVFYGPKQSGKSKMLTFLSKTCCKAIYSIIPTVSTLYRLAEDRKATILLDEFNLYKPSENKDLVAILRQGYKKGAVVPRSLRFSRKHEAHGQSGKVEDFIVVEYEVYCPIAFAGLTINDDQLLDRCIAINLLRSGNPEIICTKIDEEEFCLNLGERNICMSWGELRHFIECAVTTSAKSIVEEYRLLNNCITLDLMSGRDQEVWFPLLAIARVACNGTHHSFWDNIHAFMRDYITKKKEEDLTTFDAQVLSAISRLDGAFIETFTAKDIADILNEDLPSKEQVSSHAVGQALKRLGINYKLSQGRKRYFITEEEYKLKCQRFGLSENV